jgi:hypothetical protein
MPTPNTPPPDLNNALGAYWVSDELQDAYFLALGRFIDSYGRTESVLALYLSRFVARAFGDDSNEGLTLTRVLLGSQRTKELSDTLKRLLRVTGAAEERQETLAKALSHLGEIQMLRDRIVHQSASPEFHEGKWAVRNSNHNQIRENSQLEELYFTIEDMDDMSADLWLLQVKVRMALFPELVITPEPNTLMKYAQQPWRYKPSRLKRRRPVSRTHRKGS